MPPTTHKLGLVDHGELRALVDEMAGRRGIRKLRTILGAGWLGTDSNLERRFLALVANAGLPWPETQAWLHGFRVDFFWPDLGLVVETDGLTYHRTPAEHAVDRKRDQVLTAAGLTCLRFTNAQVRTEGHDVRRTLVEVASRLRATAA
jgi:very-short-patch-repair endonuclease